MEKEIKVDEKKVKELNESYRHLNKVILDPNSTDREKAIARSKKSIANALYPFIDNRVEIAFWLLRKLLWAFLIAGISFLLFTAGKSVPFWMVFGSGFEAAARGTPYWEWLEEGYLLIPRWVAEPTKILIWMIIPQGAIWVIGFLKVPYGPNEFSSEVWRWRRITQSNFFLIVKQMQLNCNLGQAGVLATLLLTNPPLSPTLLWITFLLPLVFQGGVALAFVIFHLNDLQLKAADKGNKDKKRRKKKKYKM